MKRIDENHPACPLPGWWVKFRGNWSGPFQSSSLARARLGRVQHAGHADGWPAPSYSEAGHVHHLTQDFCAKF
jgi:hypothetical protein